MKKFLIFFAILGVVATVQADLHEYFDTTTDTTKIEVMKKAMDAVKARLKTPDSAQFRDVHLNRGSNNILMTCGEVNSKDGLGNYTGYQKFISAGRSDLTLLEQQNTDFTGIWKKFCH